MRPKLVKWLLKWHRTQKKRRRRTPLVLSGSENTLHKANRKKLHRKKILGRVISSAQLLALTKDVISNLESTSVTEK